MKRMEFPKSVKLAAWHRAGGRCEYIAPDGKRCTALLIGKFQYDHRNPVVFSCDASLENCQVLCIPHHTIKTAREDIPAIAKSNRIRTRHAGIKPDPTIRAWRSFAGEPRYAKPREK
jgi:hypothetical protein